MDAYLYANYALNAEEQFFNACTPSVADFSVEDPRRMSSPEPEIGIAASTSDIPTRDAAHLDKGKQSYTAGRYSNAIYHFTKVCAKPGPLSRI
jgi:hypothetical protein